MDIIQVKKVGVLAMLSGAGGGVRALARNILSGALVPPAAGPGVIPIGRPYVVGGAPDQDEQCCRAAVTGSQGGWGGIGALVIALHFPNHFNHLNPFQHS